MFKTTLYIPEKDVLALKTLALQGTRRKLTYHIQQAIKRYLKETKNPGALHHPEFLKCRSIGPRRRLGEAVEYQRKLREEWE